MNKPKVPTGLRSRILEGILQAEKRIARLYLLTSGTISIMAIVGLVVSITYVAQSLAQSGTYEYVSILFSSGGLTLYWKELAYSILETAPILAVSGFLGVCGLCIYSIVKTITSAQRFTSLKAAFN